MSKMQVKPTEQPQMDKMQEKSHQEPEKPKGNSEFSPKVMGLTAVGMFGLAPAFDATLKAITHPPKPEVIDGVQHMTAFASVLASTPLEKLATDIALRISKKYV